MHALGLEFGSAAQLSKRPGSVWNCLWGNALKRPGIIRKSRVSYPGPGFLSSATWPSLPKKHYNGINQIQSTAVPLYQFSRHGINVYEVWYIEVLEPVEVFWQTLLGIGKVGDGGKSSYSINFSSSSTQ